MNKEDKLILGTLAGVDLVLSPEHYEEYKDTLNKQLEEKDKKIERLNNIINELESYLEQQWLEWKDDCDDGIVAMANEDKTVLDKLKELKESNK